MADQRCEGCQTSTCFTRWPDDDPHKPGQMRGCFAETVRSLDTIRVGPKKYQGKKTIEPGHFEKTTAGETRPGGGFMPFIGPNGPMTKKVMGNDRRKYEDRRKRLANDPNVYSSKG